MTKITIFEATDKIKEQKAADFNPFREVFSTARSGGKILMGELYQGFHLSICG
ncbi:MAG TPA: hypothetical protein V6C65_15440 [Allocoleopsis sp.]